MATDKISILAVDDETNIQEVLERGLAQAGYHCVTASSAGQAADLLQQEAFALVLLDIRMPGKSGMELLPEIIDQYPDTGVIMMTGVVDTATAVKAMREGALDYVTKPFNLDELSIRMERALARCIRMERALARRALILQNRDHKISILAVDDDSNILEMLERRLDRAGYQCTTAPNAAQAADLLRQETFALVLLDIRMPGKSGMQFLPEIIDQYPDTGVIIITGVTDTATAAKAMREGAMDYVTKPFNLDALGIRMEHALAHCRTRTSNRTWIAWQGSVRGNWNSGYGR